MKTPRKCKYFDKGYCKYKDKCPYYHPTIDCEQCENSTMCNKRHRSMCKYENICYFNKTNSCEYKHLDESSDVTMASTDNEQIQAHKVILDSKSANMTETIQDKTNEIEKLKEEIEKQKYEINKYKVEIESLKVKLKYQ